MTTRGSAMDPRNVPTIFGLATGEEKVNFPPSQARVVRSRSISLAFCAKTLAKGNEHLEKSRFL